MFKRILVLNRGEIASRIIKTINKMGIESIVVYSTADKDLPYLKEATQTYELIGNTAAETYLNQNAIIEIIKKANVDAVHPGYGFLSENPSFVRKLEEIGVAFIGPKSKWIHFMSDKTKARNKMSEHGMPVGKGSNVLPEIDGNEKEIKQIASEVGYPVLVKPSNGGGGIGMIPVYSDEKLIDSVRQARSVAQKFFSDSDVYVERYFENPRHIEIQVIADNEGRVRHLYERDCSMQRRHQKIIEESPAPNINREELQKVFQSVIDSLSKVGYNNVGTVEMLRNESGEYSFLEMNTRLQVEHPVTEETLGIDLVEQQIKIAQGANINDILPHSLTQKGHAIEVRVYAEDPIRFFPSPGKLEAFYLPEEKNIRIETGFEVGNVITHFYDPLIAKIIVKENTRAKAIATLISYLKKVNIKGLKTNIPFLIYSLESDEFQSGQITTKLTETLVKRLKKELKNKK